MKSLQVLAFVSAIAFAPVAFAADANDPSNPNCSPGVKGCTANYPTSDVSKQGPAANQSNQKADAANPNCSPGEKGCTANYPTSDTTKKAPAQPQK